MAAGCRDDKRAKRTRAFWLNRFPSIGCLHDHFRAQAPGIRTVTAPALALQRTYSLRPCPSERFAMVPFRGVAVTSA